MGTQKGSVGVLSGLNFDKEGEEKKSNSTEVKKKRSYALPVSTIKKLSEMKLYDYPEDVNLEDIVNEAIIYWYDKKHNKEEVQQKE